MDVERVNSDPLEVNQLPDGSRIIVDSMNERVFALNAMAGAAWDACCHPTTLAKVTESMQRSFDPAITAELAEEAVLQLRDKELLKTSELPSQDSRRRFLASLGAVAAFPLVASLTVGDQRAQTILAASGRPCPTARGCATSS